LPPPIASNNANNNFPVLTQRKRKTWRRALCGEQDSLREYFYAPETGESSWWLPSSAWINDNVKCYPTTNGLAALTSQRLQTVSPFTTSSTTPSTSNDTYDDQFMAAYTRPRVAVHSNSSKETANGTSNEIDQWVVRVHVSSGQMYYVNKMTGASQWHDPYDKTDDVEEEAAQEKQNVESSVRLLVGTDYLSLKIQDMTNQQTNSGNGAAGPSLSVVEHTIQQDMAKHSISFEGVYAKALLHFPEYIDPHYVKLPPTPGVKRIPFLVSDKIRIRVFSPTDQDNLHSQFFTIVPSAESTVQEVTQMAISKCASAVQRSSSVSSRSSSTSSTSSSSLGKRKKFDTNANNYVLKAVGEHSYLVHFEYPLIWYEHVQQKLRESDGKLKESAVIELHLVRVSEQESAYVEEIRKRERRDITECTKEEQYVVQQQTTKALARYQLHREEETKEAATQESAPESSLARMDSKEANETLCSCVVQNVVDVVGLTIARRHARFILYNIQRFLLEQQLGTIVPTSTEDNQTSKPTEATTPPRGPLEKHEVGLVDWEALTSWERNNTKSAGTTTNSKNSGAPRPFQDQRVHRFKKSTWMNKMKWPLRIFLRGLQNVSKRWMIPNGKEERRIMIDCVDVVVALYNNGDVLYKSTGWKTMNGLQLSNVTPPVMLDSNNGNNIHWNSNFSNMEFQGVQLCEVPRTTRIGFTLRGYTSDGRCEPLAAGAVALLDEMGQMRQGVVNVHFWKVHQAGRCPMNPGNVVPCRPCDSECEMTCVLEKKLLLFCLLLSYCCCVVVVVRSNQLFFFGWLVAIAPSLPTVLN
jgi:hypothetical protein